MKKELTFMNSLLSAYADTLNAMPSLGSCTKSHVSTSVPAPVASPAPVVSPAPQNLLPMNRRSEKLDKIIYILYKLSPIMINYITKEYSGILDIFSKIILLRIFYMSFIIFFFYNLPLILAYQLLLNGEPLFLKSWLYTLFNIFYKSPVYLSLYFYTNKELQEILKNHKGDNSPTHTISTITINISYLLLYVGYYLITGTLSLIPMSIIYSLYISQLSYTFIDNLDYKFNNPITFYNSNYIFFCFLGFIYSYIEYFYLNYYNLEIVGLFLYILIAFPILITYRYKNIPGSFNWFYIPEKILTIVI